MSIRYRNLGGTGIEVSAYCLGAMMFGADLYDANWSPPVLSDAARRRRPPADRAVA